jgi:septum site-determining protein MinC
MQNTSARKPIEIKIATVVAVAVNLHDASLDVLKAALHKMTAGTPDFFEDEFAVLDIETIAEQHIAWPDLIALLKSFGLNAVAVRNAPETAHALIRSYGLSIDVVGKARPEVASAPAPDDKTTVEQPSAKATHATQAASPSSAPIATVSAAAPAMVVDTPVRAGQRIYARGCDLIITAAVNNGAEVIADGSIHIYAPLRGRALAGASGNTNARIYALLMEPELVSIAGIYRTFENGFPGLPAQHPVQIKLIGDSIEVSSIKSVG